ncbi:MAG: helix-hairpin-helix domain-containing protein [Campylobacter sp.]|nr:helix-hairpin-helix domain-containing protein [Campylobacter sp.]
MKLLTKLFIMFSLALSFVFGAVNINTASKEELMSLKGVGESKAEAIIEYRKDNKFKSPEEIKNVKGIGDKIYNDNKDEIVVK